jgi:hypothetical protein
MDLMMTDESENDERSDENGFENDFKKETTHNVDNAACYEHAGHPDYLENNDYPLLFGEWIESGYPTQVADLCSRIRMTVRKFDENVEFMRGLTDHHVHWTLAMAIDIISRHGEQHVSNTLEEWACDWDVKNYDRPSDLCWAFER